MSTATETTKLFLNSYLAHYPRPVAIRFDPKGCFVSREWSATLTADPTAGQAYHQLGHEERTIQNGRRKNLMKSFHNSARNRLCHMLNDLDRIKEYSPFQWTFAHSRPIWNRRPPNHDDAKPAKIRTDAANVYLQTPAHRRILELDRTRNRKHVEFQLGGLVCIRRVPKGKKQSGPRWNGNVRMLRVASMEVSEWRDTTQP